MEAQLRPEAIDRLKEQSELLLRPRGPDPTRPATEVSRSDMMIAVRRSINQIYGDAAGLDIANAVAPAVDR